MSRSKKRGREFWQSAWMNDQAYLTYRMWILTLAVNRYRWIGLPATCDARYLEEILATDGMATISTPADGAIWTSTRATTTGTPSIYGTPRSWRSFGVDGFGYDVTPSNGVLVYATQLRTPFPIGFVDMYARRLADYDRAMDINVQQQKRPWLLTAPQERVNDLVQIYKQAAGGEPAILGLRGLGSDIEVQALGTATPLIINELDDGKRRMWNDVYTLLGIENLTRKAERMVQDEVRAEDAPTSLMALDGLMARRTACEQLRERFNIAVDVVWNSDHISRIFDARALAEARMLEGDGGLDG